MRFGQLDLNLLVALDRLLTHESVTAAGDEMHLTQSATSSALRRLRDYFQDPLLVQVGRRMQLTPRGLSLRQPVREILIQIELAITSDLQFNPRTSTHEFRIILSDYVMNVLGPAALAAAAREQARVRFKFLPQVRNPQAIIERGDADLLIAPSFLLSSDHPSEALYQDEFVVLAWSEGKYGSGELTRSRYLEAKHLLMVPQAGTSTAGADFLSKFDIDRHFEVECYSFSALAPLVVGTNRIATVQGALAHQAKQWLPLCSYPLPFEVPPVVEHLQWHRHMTLDPALKWLKELLHRAVRELELQGCIIPMNG